MPSSTRIFLIDIVDAEQWNGVWQTWEIQASSKVEARDVAQARLERLYRRRCFGFLAPRAKGSFVVGQYVRHKL